VSALCCLLIHSISFGERTSNIDKIVRDHAESNPAPHPVVTFVPAATEAMPALGDADASLASGSPFLTVAEPALLLLAFSLSVFGGGTQTRLTPLTFAAFSLLSICGW
jgi:hypothetical protein